MIDVKTVVSGREYRANFNGARLIFMAGPEMVTVYTSSACVGSYYLSRFDGGLSPASIRAFLNGAES